MSLGTNRISHPFSLEYLLKIYYKFYDSMWKMDSRNPGVAWKYTSNTWLPWKIVFWPKLRVAHKNFILDISTIWLRKNLHSRLDYERKFQFFKVATWPEKPSPSQILSRLVPPRPGRLGYIEILIFTLKPGCHLIKRSGISGKGHSLVKWAIENGD